MTWSRLFSRFIEAFFTPDHATHVSCLALALAHNLRAARRCLAVLIHELLTAAIIIIRSIISLRTSTIANVILIVAHG